MAKRREISRKEAIKKLLKDGKFPKAGTKLEKEAAEIKAEMIREKEKEETFTEEDVQERMKKGEIYGDPMVVLSE